MKVRKVRGQVFYHSSKDSNKVTGTEIVLGACKLVNFVIRIRGKTIIFSRAGFTAEAEAYCQEKGIACTEDERWLDTGK